jgi:hypothetical protein
VEKLFYADKCRLPLREKEFFFNLNSTLLTSYTLPNSTIPGLEILSDSQNSIYQNSCRKDYRAKTH